MAAAGVMGRLSASPDLNRFPVAWLPGGWGLTQSAHDWKAVEGEGAEPRAWPACVGLDPLAGGAALAGVGKAVVRGRGAPGGGEGGVGLKGWLSGAGSKQARQGLGVC